MAFFISDNIISPLGFTTTENFENLIKGVSGITKITNKLLYPEPFPASLINQSRLDSYFAEDENKSLTKLEKMIILSVKSSLEKTEVDIKSEKTLIILSTTKGNIDLLSNNTDYPIDRSRVLLWKLGEVIRNYFGNPNKTLVISNACISGVLALNNAAMLLKNNKFENIIVTGGDIISRFVVSGFMSFMSLSPEACKPFDKNRDGLSLGEAASTIILSRNKTGQNDIVHLGSASANDANHISGPSRTGEGSFIAIEKALKESGVNADEIDHISAHGTATPYNDEMESIAINRHQLSKAPVNSLKGSFGHTLGAAGLVETSILLEEMGRNIILETKGFSELGVSRKINVIDQLTEKELKTCLKLASGFGGSNAAMIIQKV